MKGVRGLWRWVVAVALLVDLLAPVVTASPGAQLEITRLAFDPPEPMIWNAVTVEVVVSNVGDAASGEGEVELSWCCGAATRPLPRLSPGGSEVVRFEQALTFVAAGTYTITASVGEVTHSETLVVRLRPEEQPQGRPGGWSGETASLVCPDTDLIRIGRRVPYAMDDLCIGVWGLADRHGCPAPDRDGDGVPEGPVWLDETDQCPDDPGPAGNNGCPSSGQEDDNDGDGVKDDNDSCPSEAGVVARQGCPAPDQDGDGVYDDQDSCPDVPGGANGCPDPAQVTDEDQDGDGVSDVLLARVTDSCERSDDQEHDLGCQVYWRGQKKNACGTTSLAYILRYYGVDVWPDDVDDAIRASTGTAMFTDPIGIVEYAWTRGVSAEIYINGDLEEVRSYVERGIPVMLDIANTAGSTDVNDGHWVVVISVCDVPQDFPPGTTKTVFEIYDPHGRQFSITPDRLLQFWGKMEYPVGDASVYLWTRLYIPVCRGCRLPPGNADKIREQLGLAQGIATFMKGGEEIADIFEEGEVWRIFEGVGELAGGLVGTLLSAVSMVVGWGEDIPVVGGFLGAMADFGGGMALVIEDFVNAAADLLNPETWGDPEALASAFAELFISIGEGVARFFESVWDFIVEGIGGFFKALWDGIKALGCAWFGVGCPKTVVYYKHYTSPDACLESVVQVNGLARVQPLGYIYADPAPDRSALWLYVKPRDDEGNLSPTDRAYALSLQDDLDVRKEEWVKVGMVGYVLSHRQSNVDIDLRQAVRNKLDIDGTLGYLLDHYVPGTRLLWLMKSMENNKYTVSADPCAMTETFVTPVVEGYTRELVVGYILPSEVDGAQRLYRFFDPEDEDSMLSTDRRPPEGFSSQGYVGYIYTEQRPGTVPLYQFYNRKRKDHLVTLSPFAEGLDGYDDREVLGYVYPEPQFGPDGEVCTIPLWRFCRRIHKKE